MKKARAVNNKDANVQNNKVVDKPIMPMVKKRGRPPKKLKGKILVFFTLFTVS